MNLHSKIMNLRSNATTPEGRFCARSNDYKEGHRDARHAAAELALKADAEIERLREALQAMVDCSHTMDVHCCARASQLAAAALKA